MSKLNHLSTIDSPRYRFRSVSVPEPLRPNISPLSLEYVHIKLSLAHHEFTNDPRRSLNPMRRFWRVFGVVIRKYGGFLACLQRSYCVVAPCRTCTTTPSSSQHHFSRKSNPSSAHGAELYIVRRSFFFSSFRRMWWKPGSATDPVGVIKRMFSPSSTAGIAFICGSVGSVKLCLASALRIAGWSFSKTGCTLWLVMWGKTINVAEPN